FQQDAAMLAGMLLAACAYHRYLQQACWSWWLLTLAAGLLAAFFKYYGLMVLLPLAFMTYQRHGWQWRGVAAWLGLAGVLFLPVGLWLGYVFFRTCNPAQFKAYFIFQMPELLYKR